jgi:hypothetical protein
MAQNLDVVRTEILEYLEQNDFGVFHGYARTPDVMDAVYWDVHREPDFRQFLKAAKSAGVNLVVYRPEELKAEDIEDAFDHLLASDMERDEQRDYEKRLRDLRAYEGFTCAIELSFDVGNRVYVFDLRADWYEEMQDMIDAIDASLPDDEGAPPLGGFFSQN